MHLRALTVKNFRALEDINIEFGTRVSVIVGPNAAGKTTVIEAIRLVKALLAPRTQNEAAQVLQTLGATSPHVPQRVRLEAIAQDVSKPLKIATHYRLTENDVRLLKEAKSQLATSLVQAQAGQAFSAPDALIAFLSSEAGQQRLKEAELLLDKALGRIESTKSCSLDLVFEANRPPYSESDGIEAQFAAYLERRLPPHKTTFTYFPADRALPFGEQPVQLGGPDSQQQLESYNSQPQLKFNRLKNEIFSAALLPETTRATLEDEFKRIFNGLLKGRKLKGFGINEIGFLSVKIEDLDSGRVFDLDGMSSGEKGLILTFLTIARSVENDGIVLLDEPELHLNPAVCKDLLNFVIEQYAKPRNLQVIICTHSPEILGTAFDSEECALYHLMSPTNISRVRTQDKAEISDTLRRLGASESDNLLYRGVVYVEGPDDEALIEAGFPQIVRRFKIKPSTGRAEVEKAAKTLGSSENSNSVSPSYFILDHDDEQTDIKSSAAVRVLQWSKRCLENYLIDDEVLPATLKELDTARALFTTSGDVMRKLKELAMSQLRDVALREVYKRQNFAGLGLRKVDFNEKNTSVLADLLLSRINEEKSKLDAIDEKSWSSNLVAEVESLVNRLRRDWETRWMELCDGKRLFIDLSREINLGSMRKFKLRVMREMAISQTKNWREMESLLKGLLG